MLTPERYRGIAILPAGLGGGILLDRLGMPAGLFLGCMIASGIFRMLTRENIAFTATYHHIGQIMIGLFIGNSFRLEIFESLRLALLPILAQIVILLATGFVLGLLLARWTVLDRSTSLLSSMPGGLPVMIGLATDLRHDAGIVAVIHFFRVTAIVFTMPLLLPLLSGMGGVVVHETEVLREMGWYTLVALLLIGLGSYLITRKIDFPGGAMLIPLLITGTVNLFYYEFGEIDVRFKELAIILLSVSIGAQMTLKTARTMKQVILPAACIIAILVLMGLSLGLMLYLITPLDLLTALLSSMPGGAASISAIAGDLGADLRVVASIHLIRLMFLSLLMPPLFYLIKRYRLERMRE